MTADTYGVVSSCQVPHLKENYNPQIEIKNFKYKCFTFTNQGWKWCKNGKRKNYMIPLGKGWICIFSLKFCLLRVEASHLYGPSASKSSKTRLNDRIHINILSRSTATNLSHFYLVVTHLSNNFDHVFPSFLRPDDRVFTQLHKIQAENRHRTCSV